MQARQSSQRGRSQVPEQPASFAEFLQDLDRLRKQEQQAKQALEQLREHAMKRFPEQKSLIKALLPTHPLTLAVGAELNLVTLLLEHPPAQFQAAGEDIASLLCVPAGMIRSALRGQKLFLRDKREQLSTFQLEHIGR